MNKVFYLFSVLLLLATASCKKEDKFNEMKQGEDFDVLALFDEDLVACTTGQLAYLAPSLDQNNKLVSALSKRFTKTTTTFGENVEVVVLDGQQLNQISLEEISVLADIYLQGGTILATRPTKADWESFQELLGIEIFYTIAFLDVEDDDFNLALNLFESLVNEYINTSLDEDPEGAMIAGEIVGIKGEEDYSMASISDVTEGEVIREFSETITEFDNNGEVSSVKENQNVETQRDKYANPETYSDFIYGLFADEVVEWVNTIPEDAERRVNSLKSQLMDVISETKAEVRKEDLLSKLIHTKYDVVTVPIYTNFTDVYHDNYFTHGQGRYMLAKDINRTIPVTIQINCAGIHSFEEGRDYYIIQQHVTSHNGNYNFPTDPKKWTAYYEDNFYCIGSYMAGLKVQDELHFSGPDAGSASANLIQQYCLPVGENKSATIRNGFQFGFGAKGVSFGTDGFKSKISKEGLELDFGNTHVIEEIKMTKTTLGQTTIAWNYTGGRIQGHRKAVWKIYHDIVPELQRSDCTLDQTIVYQVNNPNLAPVSLTVTPTLISECCAGHAPLTPFREKYQKTEVTGRSINFNFDRIPKFEEDWKINIVIDGKDKERAKMFRDLLLDNINECKKDRSELLSSYKPEEVQDNLPLWKLSASGKYMQDVYSKLQNLKYAFEDTISGPGPGVYFLRFTEINSPYHWTVEFEITVSDTYDLTIVPKFSGFGWSSTMNADYENLLKKPTKK